ncbi:hypothetical protein DYB35_011803, partial [Aphanomyces astaci]
MAPPLVHLKASFGAFVVACCFLYSAQVDRLPPSPAAHANFAVTAAGPRDVVADLLVNLTTAQKVGQLLQVDIRKLFDGGDDWNNGGSPKLNKARVAEYAKLGIGSFFNTPFDGRTQVQAPTAANWRAILHDIHTIYAEHHAVPFVYGIDTIHGANYIQDATLFPQPLAAASSFNVDLVYRMGQVAAKDTLAAGIPWVFSPVLGIAAQPKWSRACMKHFIGYSNPTSGNDRADSVISDFELVNYYAPSFLAAVHQGHVKSAMETYSSVNGEPVIASHKLLVELLRNDMGFHGLLVSDDDEVYRLVSEHHVAANETDALLMVFNQTSLDMNMVPAKHIADKLTARLVAQGRVSEQRMDDSVRRILQLKHDIGLLNKNQSRFVPVTAVGSAADQRDAKAAADESIILLENAPKLPVDAVSPKFTLPIEDPQA